MATVEASPQSPLVANGHYATLEALSEQRNKLATFEDLSACSSPGDANQLLRLRRKKDQQESLLESFRLWLVQNQIARSWTRPFLSLCYKDGDNGQYRRGTEDVCYIITWTIIFTALRAFTMKHLLLPFAQAAGVTGAKAKDRFAEQGWLICYYTASSAAGLYIWYHSSYWLNFTPLWESFPVLHLSTFEKNYYLIQSGFWVQQIVVVHIEERRKDYLQMLVHHIVTCFLLATSYGYHQTRVGNVILFIMDVVDIMLPVAKMLRYAGWQLACDIAFGIFILSWIFARHFIYLMVCWSIYKDPPVVMTPGWYSLKDGSFISPDLSNVQYTPGNIVRNVFMPFINPSGDVWYTPGVRYFFLTLLLFLQGITLMWLAMILRVAYGVIAGHGADDCRSEADEDEEEDLELDDSERKRALEVASATTGIHLATPGVAEEKMKAKPIIEQEVGVEGLNLKRRSGTRKQKEAKTNANGFSVASSAPKKELLGRIGCDKPT